MKTQSINGQYAVVTGASSGNGRATALRLAAEGANLILAARRLELLEEVAQECRSKGVRALAVEVDVTDMQDMRRLLTQALEFSDNAIDIWFNNAGVLALGSFTDTNPEISEQVIRTNLLGCINGAHLIIPHFIERGRGTILHMNSLSAFIPTPYVAAYSASKMGLKGFSDALRYEMSSYPDIHVCDIYATFLDTTGMDHAANLTGKKLAPPPPVYDPCKVADSVISLIKNPRDSVTLGLNAYLGRFSYALMPKLVGVMLNKATKLFLKSAPSEKVTEGNLFSPVWKGKGVHGGWKFFAAGRSKIHNMEDDRGKNSYH